jgi:hypothetical protein
VPPLVCAGVGIPFFVILLVSVAQGQPSDAGTVALITVPLILLFAAWAIRQFWSASLTIEENELVYRTTLMAKHIPRVKIVDIGIEKTRGWVPYLTMHDGSKLRLTFLSTGIVGGIDVPDRYGDNTKRMLEAVHAWLNRPGVSPRAVISLEAQANQDAIKVEQSKTMKRIRVTQVVQAVGLALALMGHAFGVALYVAGVSVLFVGLIVYCLFGLQHRRQGQRGRQTIK